MTLETAATPQTAARILNRYARSYHAGAFATPTASDMTTIMAKGGWHEYPGVWFVSAWAKRETARTDWTGRQYTIPTGTQVISHIAAEHGAKLPDLSGYGRIYAYAEDKTISSQLTEQGREVCGVRVTPASEIINCWGRDGSGHRYPSWDNATVTQIFHNAPGDFKGAVSEASQVGGWFDDYPLYSDGSWSAVSLRGFYADPSLGVKPSEMDRKWKAAHADDLSRVCGWTDLAADCPKLVGMVNEGFPGARLERVRLLRMAPPKPGKVSKLARHTDITDKAAGTADGQIMRFHIPLITHPSSVMTAWNLSGRRTAVHLGAGSMWYLDARKPHAVQHAGPSERIHLVIDVVADKRWRAVVSQGREAELWS